MQGGDIQWPAGGTACNTRFTWICCPPPLSICAAFMSCICRCFLSTDLSTPPLWICPVCVAHLPPSFNRLLRVRISTYHHLCQISSSGFSLQQNVNLTFGFNLNFAFNFRSFYKLINNWLKCHSPLHPISERDICFQCKHWTRQVFCERCQQLRLAAFVVKLRN